MIGDVNYGLQKTHLALLPSRYDIIGCPSIRCPINSLAYKATIDLIEIVYPASILLKLDRQKYLDVLILLILP